MIEIRVIYENDLTEPMPDEVRGWMQMPPGKYLKAWLQSQLAALQENWMNGAYSKGSDGRFDAEAIGRAQQIAEILLKLEELQEDRDE